MLRPSSSAEPRAKAKTPLFKCNDDGDDDVCGARVKPFLQRDLRDFLFVEEDKRRGELVLVCELGFRIFFQERRIFTNSFAGEREKKREKERKREKKREASRKSLYLLPITRRCT